MWISARDRMPEERDSIFAKYYGTPEWKEAMFRKTSDTVLITVRFENGKEIVTTASTIDGRWNRFDRGDSRVITHWMPMPEPPKKDGDVKNGFD